MPTSKNTHFKVELDRSNWVKVSICAKCHSKRRYTNPLAKCFECKKKFCFDHISNGMMNKKMKENDELRYVCDHCIKQSGYFAI